MVGPGAQPTADLRADSDDAGYPNESVSEEGTACCERPLVVD